MKGLLNNKEAVNITNRIDCILENRIHQIYNLGYKEGYKDGYNDKGDEILRTLTGQILGEMKTDE